MRGGLQARHRNVLAERLGGFAVQLGDAQIQAAQRRIGEQHVEETAGLFFLGGEPIVGAEQHRNARRVVVVGERTVGAQRQFQRGQGEAGIGGQKSAGGVDRLQDDFAAASAAHAEAQNAQQFAGVGRIAILNLDHLIGPGQLFDFARLGEIAMDQFEIFGLFQSLVAVGSLEAIGDHIARQRGQQIVGPRIAGDSGHAGERAHGPRYFDVGLVAGRIAGRRRRNGSGR